MSEVEDLVRVIVVKASENEPNVYVVDKKDYVYRRFQESEMDDAQAFANGINIENVAWKDMVQRVEDLRQDLMSEYGKKFERDALRDLIRQAFDDFGQSAYYEC